MKDLTRWVRRRRGERLRSAALGRPLLWIAGASVVLLAVRRGIGPAVPRALAIFVVGAVGTIAMAGLIAWVRSSARAARALDFDIDRNRRLEDRLTTSLSRARSKRTGPFDDALTADTWSRLGSLRPPLFGKARGCLPWSIWLIAVWLSFEPPGPAVGPNLAAAGGQEASSRSAAAASVAAEAAPEPEASESDPAEPPHEASSLDDVRHRPEFLQPLRREGETHEKEVPVQSVDPPGGRSTIEPQDATADAGRLRDAEEAAREQMRRLGLNAAQRRLVERYLDRLGR